MGVAQVTNDKYTVYTVLYTGFWFKGGEHRKNFIHEFFLSPVLQWRLQNFASRCTFSTNVLIKDFCKIFKNL